MNITSDSRFMHNQKHAVPHTVTGNFEVVRSSDGYTLFLHIADDGNLWVTREVPKTSTGWTKEDISSHLIANHPKASAITAKHFAINQNNASLQSTFDLLLVVTAHHTNGTLEDHLYAAINSTYAAADSWKTSLTWTPLPYDAGNQYKAPSPFAVNRVSCMNYSGLDDNGDPTTLNNILVDVAAPNDDLNRFKRFYIEIGTSQTWNYHPLAIDFSSDGYQSCLGRRSDIIFGDGCAGAYTFGHLGTPQLVYNPHNTNSLLEFPVPPGATAIASAPIQDKYGSCSTNLYVAGQNGLYLFPADQQGRVGPNRSVPAAKQVFGAVTNVEKQLFTNVISMMSTTNANKTTMWMLNAANQLFYTACVIGQELTAKAWTRPLCIKSNVRHFSFFVNTGTSGLSADQTVSYSDSLFTSQVSNDSSRDAPVSRLTRDPVAGLWHASTIALPQTSVQFVHEQTTFTTQIKITDEYNQPLSEQPCTIQTTGLLAAYFNNTYHVVKPHESISITTDRAGGLSIMQDRDTFSTSIFSLTTQDKKTSKIFTHQVDPTAHGYTQLAKVTGKDYLKTKMIPNKTGTLVPLAPNISDADAITTQASIETLVQAKSTVTANQLQAGQRLSEIPRPDKARPELKWDMSLGGWFSDVVDDVGNAIQSAADTIEHDVEQAVTVIGECAKSTIDGIVHLTITLAGDVYKVALDTVSAISHAVVFVFNKVKVAIDHLISWIGFLFEWDDIIRTHRVLKNLFVQYARYRVSNIKTVKKSLDTQIGAIQKKMNEFLEPVTTSTGASIAKLKLQSPTMGTQQQGFSNASANGPQMHWGTNHARHHAANAQSSYQSNTKVKAETSTGFGDLTNALKSEADDFVTTIKNMKTEVWDKLSQQSAIASALTLLKLLLDLALESAENFLNMFFDIVEDMVQGMIDMMDATLEIPIISPMYQIATGGTFEWDFTVKGGDTLTLLDLTCLIVAIPVTLIYKLRKDAVPFPDSQATNDLINASSFGDIQRLVKPKSMQPNSLTHMASEEQVKDEATFDNALDILSFSCNVSAFFGSIAVDIFTFEKYTDANTPAGSSSKLTNLLSAVAWLPYASPAISQALSDSGNVVQIMNDVAAGIALLKVLFDTSVSCVTSQTTESGLARAACDLYSDFGSPILDTVINIFWLAPAIGGLVESIEAGDNLVDPLVGFVANLAFDYGGILAPGTANKIMTEPDLRTTIQGAVLVLNYVYGGGCLALALLPS